MEDLPESLDLLKWSPCTYSLQPISSYDLIVIYRIRYMIYLVVVSSLSRRDH